MSELRRTKSGMFTIEESYTLERLEALFAEGKLESAVIAVDALFSHLPKIDLNDKQTKSIVNGVRMTYRGLSEGQSYRLYGADGKFLCISKIINGRLTLEKAFWER